jgi:hypothetical protein
MEQQDEGRALTINRLVWMGIFIAVAAAIAWMEIQSDRLPMIGWFLAAGIWSAVCGIGYSVCDWIVREYVAAASGIEDSMEDSMEDPAV